MSGLSFFQPTYLWALGFLSVILFLHFFKRRIVKRMDISTLRFLPTAAVSQTRVRKLIELLLLLARLLLICALILIFAGLHDAKSPLVALRDPQSAVYTWVDPTMSMEFAEGGIAVGQRAEDIADSLMGILPPSSAHYRFDHESGRFHPSSAREKRTFSGRFGASSLEEAVDAFLAASVRQSSGGASSSSDILIVISDFQRGTAETFDSLSSMLAGGGKTVICVSTMPVKPYNYAVRIRGEASFRDGVSAVVYAHGAELDTTFVELTVGNLRVGQRSVYCAKDDSVVVTFDMPPAAGTAGAGAWGKVELHAADRLPFDNRDFFTTTADRSRPTLIVGNVRRNRVIGAALRAAGPAFWDPVVIKEGNQISYEDLNAADLVIVNSFGGRSRILESFITGAGADKGIVIALDPDSEDDFGRAFLASSGLARGALSVSKIENGAHPVLSDTNTALWRGFPALSSANARVYRHISAIPGGVLARLGNGRTLAATTEITGGGQRQVGAAAPAAGNILIIATPIGITQANNICETGFFVPFIDRLGRRALAGRGQADEEHRYAGYPVRNPFFGTSRAGTLYDADNRLVANWSNQPFVKVERPGVYSLVSSSGETAHFTVSAHPSESEMIFNRIDSGNDDGIYYFEYGDFLEQIGDLSGNVWSYRLWVILGLLLCVECFLWKRKK